MRRAVYVGEGDLARVCKIAHNTFGRPDAKLDGGHFVGREGRRSADTFLEFINSSVMGSGFTQYKSPALVNLNFTPTFTVPLLLNKDLQLGLDAGRRLGVTMPIVSATREILQSHVGLASQRPDAKAYLENDFAAVIETLAALSGMKLAENVPTIGVTANRQPAGAHPPLHRVRRDPQPPRQARRAVLVPPQARRAAVPLPPRQAQARRQPLDHRAGEMVRPLRRPEPLGVEPLGDRRRTEPLRAQRLSRSTSRG